MSRAEPSRAEHSRAQPSPAEQLRSAPPLRPRPRPAVGGGGAGRDGRQLRIDGSAGLPGHLPVSCRSLPAVPLRAPLRPAMGNAESVLRSAASIGKCGAERPRSPGRNRREPGQDGAGTGAVRGQERSGRSLRAGAAACGEHIAVLRA